MDPHATSSLTELLANPEVEHKRKGTALLDYVQNQGRLPPGCEWIWRQGAAAAGSVEPGLLVPLLATLDTTSLSRLLTAFLGSTPSAEMVRSVCEGLLQVSESDRGRRFALAAFLDHRQLARPVLLDLLRSSRSLRERVCEVYPPQSPGLPNVLRTVLNDLPDDPAFESSLEVLLGMKPLLLDEQKRLSGWRIARRKLQELKQLQQQPPGWFAHVVRVPLKAYRTRLASLGQELAEAASWGMPNELSPQDIEGTQRAALLVQVARRVIGAEFLPAEFPTCFAACIAGWDWSAGLRKWERDERTRAASPTAAQRKSATSPAPSDASATPNRVTPPLSPAAIATPTVPSVKPALIAQKPPTPAPAPQPVFHSAAVVKTPVVKPADAVVPIAGSGLPSNVLEPVDAFERWESPLKTWLKDNAQSLALVAGSVLVLVPILWSMGVFGKTNSAEVVQVEPGSSSGGASVKPPIETPTDPQPKQTESPKSPPKPISHDPPMPVNPAPEQVAVVTPQVPKPAPPEPDKAPAISDKTLFVSGFVPVNFAVGPERKSIAYVPLPPYPETNTNLPEIRIDLPGELPVMGLTLHGFKEHKSRLSDSYFALRSDTRQASKRVLDVLHACMAKDAPAYQLPLCTFEILDQKVAVFRWHRQQSIGDVRRLEEAVRCCVLEIERGQTPEESLYVSFLKPVVIESPVEFDANGKAELPTAELLLMELSNPISLGPIQLRVVRDQSGKRELFRFARTELPRRPTAPIEDMKAAFGFAAATLQAPLPPSRRADLTMSVDLNVIPRLLSLAESNQRVALVRRISGHQAALRKPTGLNSANDYLVRESKVKMKFRESDDDFRVRVLAEINDQLQILEASRNAIDAIPKNERAEFLNSKPKLTGKFYRVVGGKYDGADIIEGVVVEAFEIREPKPQAKAKPSAE